MAYDKVTKIDSIAKRKAYSKVNEGVLTEHIAAYNRGGAFADWQRTDTGAQRTIKLTRNGKLRRDLRVASGLLQTNTATRGTYRGR